MRLVGTPPINVSQETEIFMLFFLLLLPKQKKLHLLVNVPTKKRTSV